MTIISAISDKKNYVSVLVRDGDIVVEDYGKYIWRTLLWAWFKLKWRKYAGSRTKGHTDDKYSLSSRIQNFDETAQHRKWVYPIQGAHGCFENADTESGATEFYPLDKSCRTGTTENNKARAKKTFYPANCRKNS